MERTYVYDGAGSGTNDALLMSAMNGGMGGGMWNNPIWAIVFLAALRNGGIFGNDGGNGYHSQLSQIQDTLNTNQGNTLLMDAIKGNATAISQLAQTIGCNQNAVTAAINSVQSAISGVANQVGMSGLQVINSIQSGNAALTSTLQSCCCDVKNLVTNLNYEGRLADQQQTAFLGSKIDGQTASVISKLDAIEDARKDREIASLTAALTAANSRAERAAELAPIYKTLEEIKGKQPNTVPVPWPQLTAIPTRDLLYGGYAYANGGQFG